MPNRGPDPDASPAAPLAVLHVAQPEVHGVPAVASALVADQMGRGWRVGAACPAASELRTAAERAGARWIEWWAIRAPGPAVIAETRRLAAIVAEFRPDVVHLHSAKAGLAGRLALRGSPPTVFQPHAWSFEAVGGGVAGAARRWERFAARWTDAIVCVSPDERRRGEAAGISARWAEIPNGVDLAAFPPASGENRAAARARLGLGPAPLAVAVGRLFPQKGYDVLLRAWPSVRSIVPDAELRIVGEGPERDALERLATPGARLIGAPDRVADWLVAADVVAIPSRWEAGLTLVAMEAMATARGVVATDVAGMRAGLGAGGVVVPIDSPAELSAALAERLADPALADAEGARGRLRVEERYRVEDSLAEVAALYRAVLARDGGRAR